MRFEVSPSEAVVIAGQPVVLTVELTNASTVIESYGVRALGLDPDWVMVEPSNLALFPGTTGFATVIVTVPQSYPAGSHTVTVQAFVERDPTEYLLVDVALHMAEMSTITAELQPLMVQATKVARFGLVVANEGNRVAELTPMADPGDETTRIVFTPASIVLEPGAKAVIQVEARGKRPWFGPPDARQIAFTVGSSATRVEVLGTILQRARIARGLIALVGLLVAASVFAVVLTSVFSDVVDASKVPDNLLKAAIEGDAANKRLSSTPTRVAGRVAIVGSSAGVSGATVQVYPADDPLVPVVSAASGDDGQYEIRNLAPGRYRIRFTAAGFREVWYPSALAFETAKDVEVAPDGSLDGLDVGLGGQPGTIKGKVVGDKPDGAQVRLVLPGETRGSTIDAEAAVVAASADGGFVFEKVPAPATYRIEVTKAGFARETREVKLGAAEERNGIELLLRRGDGAISGLVRGPLGALGGVEIAVSDGTRSVSTTSLTTDPPGTFVVRDLVTPASYTLKFTHPGFRPEVLTVKLAENQPLTGLTVSLSGAEGSISGVARGPSGAGIGGVEVTASNGEITVSSLSLSSGQVGAYTIVGLPAPSSYTLTFSKIGYVSQSRSTDIDPLLTSAVIGVDTNLQIASASLTGKITDTTGPIADVAITVTDGAQTFSSASANEPLGSYRFPRLPPGTYTVTFSRSGSVSQTFLVALEAGDARVLDVSIAARSSIAGLILSVDNLPLAGAEVRLYLATGFPGTAARVLRTGADGRYLFIDLDAPESYVIEFASAPNAPGVASVRVDLTGSDQRTGIDYRFLLPA